MLAANDAILFYKTNDPYFEFTNFAKFPIKIDDKVWPTSEHYFQAQKFSPKYPDLVEQVRQFSKPREAFDAARTYKEYVRNDWQDIKESIMKKALFAKFTQHQKLTELLLATGDRGLIENSPYDNYWGNGGSGGSGQNRLGILLMELRTELRAAH